ncbi:MAG TPA: carboxypeptidase regulatory-like domain-containing protein [Thermoanaerobaculia bacterium]|nr:carboxypeptidase regulatory-like domain-containing protein [Thermoanaerobaculia bacterium]
MAGAPVEGLELRLATGGVLRGRILGLSFERLAGVYVAASRIVSPGTFEEARQGRVDFEGKYEIRGITPGEWTVGAESGGASTVKRITVPEGASEVTLDLDFTGGLTLSGSVLRGGEPVSGLNILAAGKDIDDSSNGTTGDRGEFRLEGLEPGRYTLYLFNPRSNGHHQEQVDLSTDREIVIELPNQWVSGRVIDATDSSPVAGAVISLESVPAEGGTRLGATSDQSGAFTVSQVPEGTWRAVARKDGYAPAETTVEVRPGSDVEGVRLSLSPGAGLVLEVLAATGNPPARIFAALQDAAGRTVVGDSYETGEGGRVRIGSAPAGNFRLFVSAAGSATVSLDVTIPGDPVRLTLPPGSHLAVRVPALEGDRTAATLTIVDPGGQPLRLVSFGAVLTIAGMSHRGGSFFLDDVPPGTWTVRVAAADGRSWEGTATTTGGRTEIVLE